MSKAFASLFSTVVAMALPLALAACDDADLPKVFGSEVPQQVLDAPRPVPSPPPVPEGQETVWPLLGNTPLMPKNFTPQPTIDAAKKEMEQDRDTGKELQQNYQEAPPVLPSGQVGN